MKNCTKKVFIKEFFSKCDQIRSLLCRNVSIAKGGWRMGMGCDVKVSKIGPITQEMRLNIDVLHEEKTEPEIS